MFTWSADKIRFLRDASEYTPFNDALADRAAAFLPVGGHICDAGCGLGYLSVALAKHCQWVTAADVCPEALAVLRQSLAARPVGNVSVMEADVFALPDDVQFDAMVFCFFGGTHDILRCVKRHCRGKAVLFKKNWATHRFTADQRPLERFTFAQTCAELTRAGIPCHSESFEQEMGQPFRSMADAALFFRLYDRGDGDVPLSDAALYARLKGTGSAEFPYFLQSKRPVGMIVLDTEDIPENLRMEE